MGPSVSYAILCAGDFPARSEVLGALLSCDVSVCCDSAAGSLLAYRRPDFVVGDMDSLSQRLRDELSDRVFEVSEQESNDMSKAFRLVCSVLGIGGSVPVPEFQDSHAYGLRDVRASSGHVQSESSCRSASVTVFIRSGTSYRQQRASVSYRRRGVRHVVEGHSEQGLRRRSQVGVQPTCESAPVSARNV